MANDLSSTLPLQHHSPWRTYVLVHMENETHCYVIMYLSASPIHRLSSFPFGSRAQRIVRIVPNTLNNPEPLGLALPEEHSVPRSQKLGSLDETEGDNRAVPSADERAVNVDNGAGLTDGTHMQHGLVLAFDGCSVGKDENFAS